jgi:predicted metal-dependent phosphoesterase TrpH
MQAMCHRLTELGMPVNYQNVERRAGGSVGRPHLAEEMIDLGYVSSKQEAFEKWIGDGLPGFVPHQKPSIAEAVQAVKAAGGITSLAHPLYYGVPPTTLCKTLADLGVNAVETVHRSHSDAYRFSLQQAAEANGLSTTVGSDFHGLKSQTRPGHMPVPVGMLPKSLTDV